MKKIALISLLLTLSSHSMAYSTSTPTQFSGLEWTVSGATGLEPKAYCTSMSLNGVTDFTKNSIINFSGVLNCNSGAYVVSGTGYLNVLGGVSFGLKVGGNYFWNCSTDSALNASCSALNYAGSIIAYPNINFR